MDTDICMATILYTAVALIAYAAVRYYLGLEISALQIGIFAVIIAIGFYLSLRYFSCGGPKKKK